MLQIFPRDEDGLIDTDDLSHLGAGVGVNAEEVRRGYLYKEETRSKDSKAVFKTISPERYIGLERRLRPNKHRDEGERRIGCPRKMTPVIRRLIGTKVRES